VKISTPYGKSPNKQLLAIPEIAVAKAQSTRSLVRTYKVAAATKTKNPSPRRLVILKREIDLVKALVVEVSR